MRSRMSFYFLIVFINVIQVRNVSFYDEQIFLTINSRIEFIRIDHIYFPLKINSILLLSSHPVGIGSKFNLQCHLPSTPPDFTKFQGILGCTEISRRLILLITSVMPIICNYSKSSNCAVFVSNLRTWNFNQDSVSMSDYIAMA